MTPAPTKPGVFMHCNVCGFRSKVVPRVDGWKAYDAQKRHIHRWGHRDIVMMQYT